MDDHTRIQAQRIHKAVAEQPLLVILIILASVTHAGDGMNMWCLIPHLEPGRCANIK